MQRGTTDRYEITTVDGEQVRAFVPYSLPPDPPLQMELARQRLLEQATLALGRLDLVRTEGNWEAWLDFFLEGVETTATIAVQTAQRLVALFQEDRARIFAYKQYMAILNEGTEPL